MGTTINLKIKDEKESIIKSISHEIEDIDLGQFQEMMKVINEILKGLQEDPALKDLFSSLFQEDQVDPEDPTSTEEKKKETEGLDFVDKKFLSNLINSFEPLLVHMPDKAIKLLSILSGISLQVLKKQKLFVVLDIYEAVIEENDLERLVNRIKKSLVATRTKMAFMNFGKRKSSAIAPA
ncbi:hypothetical protein [Bacillus suaedae]|uniref:Uncharacterized protein n=1 Tax=Halalkalibacter suaedae TaxID=2822140 RepID=A0A940WQ85_9BACI|nr:hypothetical protein [Bacillus suaedae]MBP3950341.1 hypothetical protein [Bacillus suaedae]